MIISSAMENKGTGITMDSAEAERNDYALDSAAGKSHSKKLTGQIA